MQSALIKQLRHRHTQRILTEATQQQPSMFNLFIKNPNIRFKLAFGTFCSTYLFLLYKARQSTNETLRVGAAGSITMLIGESSFYCVDAVNAKSKILNQNLGFKEMVMKIIKDEGVYGLYRGYSASFYASVISGFIYFFLYKHIKHVMKNKYDPQSTGQNALIYAGSSTIAEVWALLIYYPFELVKIRFLTKNNIYNYESVSDAMHKIVRKDSYRGLYRGLSAFFMTYIGQYTIQMTIYELIIDTYMKKLGQEKFMEKEYQNVIKASLVSGMSAALLTNSLEVYVIRKQAETGETMRSMITNEGLSLFTKGLTAKLLLTGGYSIIFFMSMNQIGKLFDTNLSE